MDIEKLICVAIALSFLGAILRLLSRSQERMYAFLFGIVLIIFCTFYLFQFGSLGSVSVKAMSTEASFFREKKTEVVQDAKEIAVIKDRIRDDEAKIARDLTSLHNSINTAKEELAKVRSDVKKVRELADLPSLVFFSSKTEKHEGRYIAIVDLTPSKNEPLGILTLHAKIIGNVDAKIVDFWPRDVAFSSAPDSKRIASDGKSAQLSFALLTPSAARVQLVVSAPTRAHFYGSHHLKPFDIAIR